MVNPKSLTPPSQNSLKHPAPQPLPTTGYAGWEPFIERKKRLVGSASRSLCQTCHGIIQAIRGLHRNLCCLSSHSSPSKVSPPSLGLQPRKARKTDEGPCQGHQQKLAIPTPDIETSEATEKAQMPNLTLTTYILYDTGLSSLIQSTGRIGPDQGSPNH